MICPVSHPELVVVPELDPGVWGVFLLLKPAILF